MGLHSMVLYLKLDGDKLNSHGLFFMKINIVNTKIQFTVKILSYRNTFLRDILLGKQKMIRRAYFCNFVNSSRTKTPEIKVRFSILIKLSKNCNNQFFSIHFI